MEIAKRIVTPLLIGGAIFVLTTYTVLGSDYLPWVALVYLVSIGAVIGFDYIFRLVLYKESWRPVERLTYSTIGVFSPVIATVLIAVALIALAFFVLVAFFLQLASNAPKA